MLKPSEYYVQGFNCAESMIKSFNEEFNKEIPISIGSGMGRGAFSGSMCGAINGALVIIGYLYGRNDNTESNEANSYARKLMTTIKEKYSTEICRELKANRVGCAEIIDFSYETLKSILVI